MFLPCGTTGLCSDSLRRLHWGELVIESMVMLLVPANILLAQCEMIEILSVIRDGAKQATTCLATAALLLGVIVLGALTTLALAGAWRKPEGQRPSEMGQERCLWHSANLF